MADNFSGGAGGGRGGDLETPSGPNAPGAVQVQKRGGLIARVHGRNRWAGLDLGCWGDSQAWTVGWRGNGDRMAESWENGLNGLKMA